MGSSKKHSSDKDREGHREHKRKKRHKSPGDRGGVRSRSRSPSHKKHKHEKKSRKRERDYLDEIRADRLAAQEQYRGESSRLKDEGPEDGEIPEPSTDAGVSGDGSSLSIQGTNKLRAKLGLAPLNVGPKDGTGEGSEGKKEDEDIHVPAQNLAAIRKQEELRQKMAQIREKRKINQKLGKVKTLGESDSEDEEGALAWINKNRKIIREREMAEKRAKLLDQMDEEFGIGDLVEEAFASKKPAYTAAHLKGLTVKHDIDRFQDGKNVILTLEDRRILDDDGEEVLINVNLVDDEIADKNNERKLKKPEYDPYDDGEEGGLFYADVLDKYDEKKDKTFTLGKGGTYKADYERQIKQFKEDAQKRAEALTLPSLQVASEYYTQDEMDAKFKKIKKKVRKIRKKPKNLRADDLEPLEEQWDFGRRGEPGPSSSKSTSGIPGLDLVKMEVDPTPNIQPPKVEPERQEEEEEDLTGVGVDDEEARFELELAVKKARKLKVKKEKGEQLIADRLKNIKKEEPMAEETGGAQNIVLNSTSEFCRTLGDIPTYGQSGNRDEDEDDLMDLDNDDDDDKNNAADDEPITGWQSVEIDTRPVDIKDEEHAAIEEEPIITGGTIGALALAQKKGYLEQASGKRVSAPTHLHLQAKNYSIEDKRYDDLDEKYRKRDRYHMGGISQEFCELEYKPEVTLEYVDETGRVLSEKEAFRQLSHRFHGKGSGKKKTEKRCKKLEQDHLLKTASSSDTPLGTVALLQEKQKQEKTAFVILSGGNKGFASTSISK